MLTEEGRLEEIIGSHVCIDNDNKTIYELLTAFALPPICICLNCSQFQLVSKLVERTNVKCTPKLLCTAEQSMQMNTP